MCLLLSILFYLALFAFLFTYLFYPLLLFFLYLWKKKSKQTEDLSYLPSVSVLIPVYNEEAVLKEKVLSVIHSSYPAEKLKIFIGSDASTDQSAQIVNTLKQEFSTITFYDFPTRRGKAFVVNDLLDFTFESCPIGSDHIILFTDANVILQKDTISKLVHHFSKPQIALVDSRIIPSGLRDMGISKSENTYIGLEGKLKFWEGELFGCMMGAFGGCYAVRSNYVSKIPANFIVDDFYMSMEVLNKGGKNIVAPDALCYEVVPDKIAEEFKRKIRISSGNFQNLYHFRQFMITAPVSRAFCFTSHKVLRWLGPFFILILFVCSALLIPCYVWYSFILYFLILLFFGIPLLDWALQRFNMHFRKIRNIRYFCLMNLALFIGFIKYVRGIKSGSWEPPKRSL